MNKEIISNIITDAINLLEHKIGIGMCVVLIYAFKRREYYGINSKNISKYIPEFTEDNYIQFCKDNTFVPHKENNTQKDYWDSDKRTLGSDTRRIEFLKHILKHYEYSENSS